MRVRVRAAAWAATRRTAAEVALVAWVRAEAAGEAAAQRVDLLHRLVRVRVRVRVRALT